MSSLCNNPINSIDIPILKEKVAHYNTTLISPLQQLDTSTSPQPPPSPQALTPPPPESIHEDSVDCPTYLKDNESLDLTVSEDNNHLAGERKLKQKTVKF